ncbi:MAG: N(4)-(beta-N-acetylglucosaminyl)-L-asparaginase [Planctomycetota bacterium]|jgi:isoaspartyl peptidase/L-asparaginase-like protein (Ntn-hydrolase superfamily)
MKQRLLSTWSFGLRGHAVAWPPLRDGGSALDAVEAVCRTVEADPEVDSVGRGGLPDRDGRMCLDAAVMLAPGRCGAVAAVSSHLPVVSVARRVMERTDEVLLVGEGAERFADEQGFARSDLLEEAARAAWLRWRESPAPVDQSADGGWAAPPRPVDASGDGRLFVDEEEARWRHHDTISVIATDGGGGLAAASSTSGTPFKRPGRVGDVPIIGHGLYVDPPAGAAVATGTGELIMRVSASFLVVELMRAGRSPLEALHAALDRIAAIGPLREEHQVAMIAAAPDGTWSSAALRAGFRVSVTDAGRNEIVEPELVLV